MHMCSLHGICSQYDFLPLSLCCYTHYFTFFTHFCVYSLHCMPVCCIYVSAFLCATTIHTVPAYVMMMMEDEYLLSSPQSVPHALMCLTFLALLCRFRRTLHAVCNAFYACHDSACLLLLHVISPSACTHCLPAHLSFFCMHCVSHTHTCVCLAHQHCVHLVLQVHHCTFCLCLQKKKKHCAFCTPSYMCGVFLPLLFHFAFYAVHACLQLIILCAAHTTHIQPVPHCCSMHTAACTHRLESTRTCTITAVCVTVYVWRDKFLPHTYLLILFLHNHFLFCMSHTALVMYICVLIFFTVYTPSFLHICMEGIGTAFLVPCVSRQAFWGDSHIILPSVLCIPVSCGMRTPNNVFSSAMSSHT